MRRNWRCRLRTSGCAANHKVIDNPEKEQKRHHQEEQNVHESPEAQIACKKINQLSKRNIVIDIRNTHCWDLLLDRCQRSHRIRACYTIHHRIPHRSGNVLDCCKHRCRYSYRDRPEHSHGPGACTSDRRTCSARRTWLHSGSDQDQLSAVRDQQSQSGRTYHH